MGKIMSVRNRMTLATGKGAESYEPLSCSSCLPFVDDERSFLPVTLQ